jgi:penicillin-binding protein A
LLGTVSFVSILFFLGRLGFGSDPKTSVDRVREERAAWKKQLALAIPTTRELIQSKTISVHLNGQTRTAELTLDIGFQRFLSRLLERYRVDWGGVAVVDATTGAVLALGSHSEKEPNGTNLALRATFPAASIFKIVTAAAGIEEGKFERTSEVRFNGRSDRIRRRDLLGDKGAGSMTITEAFARSANAVFGKVGARELGGTLLQQYADRFGFNQTIPLDVAIETSLAQIPSDNPYLEAQAAAGFTGATLSPLHGALLASAALNGGRIMQPYLVQRLFDQEDHVLYEAVAEEWIQPVGEQTAFELRRMMSRTVTQGTARRGYRAVERDRTLNNLDLGGKTGSLSGDDPKGRNEWFVGYASSAERKVAIGIVLVSEKYWRVKPSRLSREILDFYFSPRPTLEARVEGRQPYGP